MSAATDALARAYEEVKALEQQIEQKDNRITYLEKQVKRDAETLIDAVTGLAALRKQHFITILSMYWNEDFRVTLAKVHAAYEAELRDAHDRLDPHGARNG